MTVLLVSGTAATKPSPPDEKRKHHPRPSVHRQKKIERCEAAREAVPYYRFWTHLHQTARGAEKFAGPGPKVRGRSCGYARYAAAEWRARAVAARDRYERYLERRKRERRLYSYHGGNPNVHLGQRMARAFGWHTGAEWDALYTLWNRESGWDHRAQNSSSGACGIPQDISSCHGFSPSAQIAWGLRYIRGRYGSPTGALAAFYAKGWY